ncbi:mannosyltransferase [Richelia sinica]|nr:mannosyltransferase [Richelia sinica]MBD2664946.1 mannosyltransferase [Richelia sinica FACHB-800]
MNRRFQVDIFLTIILLLSLIIRVVTALKFPNMFWADEIFQTQEPAHRLAFGHGIVTWEFRDGIRSWVFPGILAVVMGLTAWLGEGSTGYVTGINVFLSLISLSLVVIAFLWGNNIGGRITAVICASISMIWFELIYFSPKAFTEVVATHFLLPGLYLSYQPKYSPSRQRLFLAGCLLGIALALRIHLLPCIALALVYICKTKWRYWLPMLAGITGVFLIFGTVDAFTWTYPFQSFWLNIWVNLVEGRSKLYGVSPWYEYVVFLLKSWSWLFFPMMILVVIGSRRSPILGWLAFIIILSHSLLAHKEYRFIYPAIPMLMILAGLGTAELVINWLPKWLSLRKIAIAVLLSFCLWTSSSVALASRFNLYAPLNFSTFGTNLQATHWTAVSENLLAFQSLSHDKNVCGLGLWGVNWALSGGYTYLHHDVPIFPVEKDGDFEQLNTGFNYVIANRPLPPPYQNYQLQQCWQGTCVYQRPGACDMIPNRDINYVLKQSGN